MPESIRAMIVILACYGAIFWLFSKPISTIISTVEYSRWRNIWLVMTITAFLSPDFWIFAVIVTLILFLFGPKQPEQRIIYYLFLLCVLPILSSDIPGFAGINYIFKLSYPRLLTFILLVPLLFLTKQFVPHNLRLFRLPTDWFAVTFILLWAILGFRDTTITDGLRNAFILFVDTLIPYYVISRYLHSLDQFTRAFAALLIAITILSLIGIFEAAKHWHLYHIIMQKLSDYSMGYGDRSGILRASAIFTSPIILGYVLMIGFGILLYLRPLIEWRFQFYLIAFILMLGILATISRGPWVGFAALCMTYILTGREKIKNLTLSILSFMLMFPFLFLTKFGDKFLDLLPFVGTTAAHTVSYREQLFDNAWIVILRNPYFGSMTYNQTPEMESMRQGQGIIDLVNTYIKITLETGLIGVALFVTIFSTLIFGTYKTIKILPSDEVDMIRLGRVLIAILVGIIVTIGTVSTIDHVPIFYWAFIAITASYIHLAKQIIYESR
jgi:O-antigen ligase